MTALIILPLAFYGGHNDPFWGTERALVKITGFSLILIYLIRAALSGRLAAFKTPVDVPAAVFFAAVALGSLVTVNKFAWLDKAANLLSLAVFFYGAVFFAYTDKNSVKKIIFACLASAIISAGYGILQASGIDFVSYQTTFNGRAASTFGNPNFLAGHMILLIPLCAALAIDAKSKAVKTGAAAAAAVLFLAMLFTQTRGAYLGFGFSVVVLALLFGRDIEKRKAALITAAAALLFGALYLGLNQGALKRVTDFVQGRDNAGEIRVSLWKNALHIIREKPVFGTGAGNFSIVYPYYQSRSMKPEMYASTDIYKSSHTHNDYLQAGAEYGLIAAGAFFAFAFIPVLVILRRGSSAAAAGAASGMAAVAVHALFNFPFIIYPTAAVFFALGGMISAESGGARSWDKTCGVKGRAVSGVFAAAAAVVCCIVIVNFLSGAYLRKAKENDHFKKPYEASLYASRAAEAGPFDDENLYYAAVYAMNTGAQERSAALLKKAYALNPGNWEVNQNLYAYAQYVNDYELAEKTAANMNKISPYAPKTIISLGYAFFNNKKPMQAVHVYEAGLALWPDNFDMTHHLSASYGAAGIHDKAVEFAKRAVALNPAAEGAHYNLAVALYKKGDFKEAKAAAEKSLVSFPDSQMLKGILKVINEQPAR